jgi:2-iminobutanoate/2-iminopropanoate deaminase
LSSIKWIAGITAAISFGLLAGCNTTGGPSAIGIPWVKQGPGNEDEARRAAPPAPRTAPKADAAPSAPAAAPAPAGPTGPRFGSARAGLESFAQARRYENLLFVSGQIALDQKTNQLAGTRIEDQTSQVMENIAAILESHKLGMANVVSVTVYLKDLNDFRGMDSVYESYFRGSLPARSVIEVSRLPRGALVEITVIAGR